MMLLRRVATVVLALPLAACAPAVSPAAPAAPAAPVAQQPPALPAAPVPEQRRTIPVLDSATIVASCEATLRDARARASELESLPIERASVETVLNAWDRNAIARDDVIGPIAILNNVHPERRVRDAAEGCLRELSRFSTELYQNEALFRRISAVRSHDPIAAKLQSDLIRYFEDSGVSLAAEQRERAGEIAQRLTALQQEFERNLRDDTTRITFTPDEYRGVPQSYVDRARRDAAGNISVSMETPDYVPFIRNAVNPDARRRYYVAFLNRGGTRNLEILDEMARLRREAAALHGQPSFAHHVIRRRMATTPEAVRAFLDRGA